MTAVVRSKMATWVALLAFSFLSYLSWLEANWADPRVPGSLVILIALAKAWLIGTRFMELRGAWRPLRLIFASWLVMVGATLLVMFGRAP